MLRNALENLATEATLDDILTESQAQSAQLAALVTELGQKLEPGGAVDVNDRAGRLLGHVTVDNLAGLATEATLATRASESTISALSGKIGTPASDDLLSLLRDIKTNTGLEVTAV